MDFIRPKYKDKKDVDWKISKRTQLIVSYYAEYTGYSEDEVVDFFLGNNIIKDMDFVDWLKGKRSKKKIETFILNDIDGDFVEEVDPNVQLEETDSKE